MEVKEEAKANSRMHHCCGMVCNNAADRGGQRGTTWRGNVANKFATLLPGLESMNVVSALAERGFAAFVLLAGRREANLPSNEAVPSHTVTTDTWIAPPVHTAKLGLFSLVTDVSIPAWHPRLRRSTGWW